MSKKASDPKEVPVRFIDCRAFRHQTRHVNDSATWGTGGVVIEFVRHTRCVNCKVDVFTTYGVPDFRVVRRKYIYPDNYQVKGGYPVFDARSDYITHRFGTKEG